MTAYVITRAMKLVLLANTTFIVSQLLTTIHIAKTVADQETILYQGVEVCKLEYVESALLAIQGITYRPHVRLPVTPCAASAPAA